MEFAISDLHLNHNKTFIYESRDYDSIQEHDEGIIKNWNDIVRPSDEVWFLGDIGLGSDLDYLARQVSRLNGTVHWIRGNHDSERRWETIGSLGNIIREGWAIPHKWNGQRFWLSHYPTLCAPIDAKPFYQSMISLCGHTHARNSFKDWGDYMIYHVDWDAHNRPISFEEIMNSIRNQCEGL